MAFRIQDSVLRGEIDNRVKGVVRGKIWLDGRTEPIILELKGNAWPDLAGCELIFTNPQKTIRHHQLDSLAGLQEGLAGDMTASRKVRVYDIPLREATAMIRSNQTPPEHMANALSLEWFSQANGRVVIESADFTLRISEPSWRMTAEDELERQQQAAAAMQNFMSQLSEQIERHQRGQKDPEEKWDEHDYEKFLKESDARTDKFMELLDKYGDSDEGHEKISREMGWDDEDSELEDEPKNLIEEVDPGLAAAIGEAHPDPLREGIDWIRTESGELRHPLQYRCFQSAVKFRNQVEDLGLKRGVDEDLENFICEFQITGAKLAGALNGVARGAGFSDHAFTVAALKRALDHLHKCQAGLESAASKKSLPKSLITEARRELFELREGILHLMDEFRRRC